MSNFIKKSFTDKQGIEKFLSISDYKRSFGGPIIDSQPFTTNTTTTGGFAHYQKSIWASGGPTNSGLWFSGADSSGLNPFGPNTFGQGIISGSGRTDDLDTAIVKEDVRTYGIKNPSHLVGWGYDKFGYPAPNSSSGWNISGTIAGSAPNTTFPSSGSTTSTHGSNAPYDTWNAGPMDWRWDVDRKVWTSNSSVFAAYITKTYISGVVDTDFSASNPQFATDLKYDAIVYDGTATRIQLTGVAHIGPKPYSDNYKVEPLASGTFCFIVHANNNGIPGYALWTIEQPGSASCTPTTSSGASLFGGGTLSDNIAYSDLVGSPLSSTYGGTGFGDYPSGYILVGNVNSNGALAQYKLTAGSGINIYTTGVNLNIALSTGIVTVNAGVNSNINELQGLTTPLTVTQGGTGANFKNFIDTTGNQSVSGIKTFANPIRFATGTIAIPSLTVANDPSTGFYGDLNKLGITASGTRIFETSSNSGVFHTNVYIEGDNTLSTGINSDIVAPLVIKQYQNALYSNPITAWLDSSNGLLSKVSRSGKFSMPSLAITGSLVPSGNLIEIFKPSNQLGYTIMASGSTSGMYFGLNKDGTQLDVGPSGNRVSFVQTSGNISVCFASGYNGDITMVHPTLVGTRTLHLSNGLITGYSDA